MTSQRLTAWRLQGALADSVATATTMSALKTCQLSSKWCVKGRGYKILRSASVASGKEPTPRSWMWQKAYVVKFCVTEVYSLGTSRVVPAWRRWLLRMPLI